MLVATKKPILQVDKKGDIVRAQYNEVFRTPSTVPFDKFHDWYRAFLVWNDMIHGSEFEVEVPLGAGQILVIDNWRVLHGRAGGQSSSNRDNGWHCCPRGFPFQSHAADGCNLPCDGLFCMINRHVPLSIHGPIS